MKSDVNKCHSLTSLANTCDKVNIRQDNLNISNSKCEKLVEV